MLLEIESGFKQEKVVTFPQSVIHKKTKNYQMRRICSQSYPIQLVADIQTKQNKTAKQKARNQTNQI